MSTIPITADNSASVAKKKSVFLPVAELLLPHFPDLKEKLRYADMKVLPLDYLETTASLPTERKNIWIFLPELTTPLMKQPKSVH